VFDKEYRVTRSRPHHWAIALNGYRAGDFPTGQAATARAEHLAKEARGCGYDAELVIEDDRGRVRERRRFAR
jgi:phage replication-related protein YjqB (UPF0714/DUF867 family)